MNAIDIKQESRNRPHARAVGHYLAATAGRHGRYQDRAAAGLVSVERHRDAVDQHLGVALGDLAFAVAGDRTSAAIALRATATPMTLLFGAAELTLPPWLLGSFKRITPRMGNLPSKLWNGGRYLE